MGNLAKVGIGLAVTGLLVWLVLREVSLEEVARSIASANENLIALAVGMFLLGYICRVQRWRLMLLHENPDLRWQTAAVAFFASIAANNLLPLRAGDALRAFGFTAWLKVPASVVVATVLVERLLDLLTLLILLALVFALLPVSNALAVMMGVGITGIAGAASLLLFILLFPKTLEPLVSPLPRALACLHPSAGSHISGAFEKVFETLKHLAGHALMPKLIGWSLFAWGLEAGVFVCAALALAPMQDPLAGLVAMPVGTLSTLVPSSPGYVGTFHFFVAKTIEIMGSPFSVGVSYAVIVHLILWLTATLVGGVCLLIWIAQRRSARGKLEESSSS